MSAPRHADGVRSLAAARRGHFALESGYHGELWLDLDALFAEPQRIAPLARELARALAAHEPEAICGPLLGGAFLAQLVAHELGVAFGFAERVSSPAGQGLFAAQYRIPPAVAQHLAGKRVAIVDDVMSAGSSLRATHASLEALDATTVAAGALLVLGDAGENFFAARGIPVVTLERDAYPLWAPDDCPMCRAGVMVER